MTQDQDEAMLYLQRLMTAIVGPGAKKNGAASMAAP
jgi:hypothetical protein